MPGPTIQDVLDRIDALETRLVGISALQEFYNVGNDSTGTFADTFWRGQGFTATKSHRLASINLNIYRLGSPGTVTVSIRASDGEGKPTGSDLVSASFDGNTLPTTATWHSVSFGSGIQLLKDTQYFIIARAIYGHIVNDHVRWVKNSVGTYQGGGRVDSSDSGVTWTNQAGIMLFEEYLAPALGDLYPIVPKLDNGDLEVYTESQHARQG